MSRIVEKSADERQVFGHTPLDAPFQLDAEKFACRAADIESARFERRTHPIGMTARIPVGTGTTAFRTMETGADIGERTAADAPLHIEQPRFDPLALGTHQSACLRQGQSLLLRHDLRSDDERRRIARQILLDGEPEGRTTPAAPVTGAGAAIFRNPLRIAETGDVIGRRQLNRGIFGTISV